MSDSEAELTLILKAKNLASKEVDKLHGSLSKLGGTLATVAKLGVIALAAAGAVLVGILVEGAKRAAEEQVGIAKLGAALKANIKHFDGNTDAIEKVIAKREELAFSDDELRTSLTFLVTKYHDVARAQDIQSTAMDVARLKGISLADATVLVSKGMDGSSKVLKQLGIDLPATASAQERLTAIQKKAAGQAEAYSKTAAGGQKAFQIAMDDVLEDVGSAFLPLMTQFFNMLRLKVIPAVRDIIGRVQAWYSDNKPLITQIKDFAVTVLGTLFTIIGNVLGRLKDVITWISNSKPIMNGLRTTFDIIAKAIGFVVDALKQLVKWAEKAVGWLANIKAPDITGITDLIPHFASGGTIPGPRGSAQLIVGHGGEKVSSGGAGGGGGGGGTVYINSVWPPTQAQLREIMTVLEREMGYRLAAAPPTRGR